ncbi:MAG: nicotinamide-nucleotide amidohydrolase family protein [Kiloniellaceae bacterium]|nr:nicotinamide-nucleotide amidohydrolase family protein [Kiloniellaceae bacterium]
MFDAPLLRQAEALLALYRQAGKRLATAESCTGGLIAGCLTEIAGSSDVVDRGFVTYSNAAKAEMLSVAPALLDHPGPGAVSAEVAAAMAEGALQASRADVAVSATGIAGPGGATEDKPVGLVYLGWATREGKAQARRHLFPGDRAAVRLATLREALRLFEEVL